MNQCLIYVIKKKTVRHGISSKSGFILGKTPQARPLTTSMQSCHTLSLLVSQWHPCIPELISLSIHLLKRSTHFLTKIISLKRSFSSQPFFSHDHTNYLILSFLIFIACDAFVWWNDAFIVMLFIVLSKVIHLYFFYSPLSHSIV